MKYEFVYITAKEESGEVSITDIDGVFNSYFSLGNFFDAMRRYHVEKVFMADTQLQFSYLLDYAKHNGLQVKKLIQNKGNIYAFILNGIKFVSCDNIYNSPFDLLCEEFQLGKPSGNAIRKLVGHIEDLGEGKFSFVDGEYYTIGGLAWLWLTKGFCGNQSDIMGAKYNNHFHMKQWDFFKENDIYRGGICLLNERYRGRDVHNLYKYDVNSFFLYVMATGNMPVGKYFRKEGKPTQLKDVVVHVRITGITRFPGIATIPCGRLYFENVVAQELWLWGDELEELMIWNDLSIEWLEYLEWEWNEPDAEFRKFACHFFPQKKDANGIRRRGVKLIINNSYGKWGQSPVQHTYSLNDAGEWKQSKEFINYKLGVRSLAVASKITALSRTELLRRIRKATNNRPDLYFVYGDTDSMILTQPIEETDIGDGLGMWKFEGWFEKGVFLGKKCYLLYDGEEYEAHACGVNRRTLQQALLGKNWEEAREMFDYDKEFMCPVVVRGNGGKYRTMAPRIISRGFEKSNFNPIYGTYEQGDDAL